MCGPRVIADKRIVKYVIAGTRLKWLDFFVLARLLPLVTKRCQKYIKAVHYYAGTAIWLAFVSACKLILLNTIIMIT